jgi:hypothetical protein
LSKTLKRLVAIAGWIVALIVTLVTFLQENPFPQETPVDSTVVVDTLL